MNSRSDHLIGTPAFWEPLYTPCLHFNSTVAMNGIDPEKVEVERNAASRFVDFSCSTEWEKSVLKIENLIRAFVLKGKDNDSEVIRLMGMKLRITFHSNDSYTADYLPSLFEISNRYILISRAGNDWLDCTTSQRHTMLSVLVTALQSSLSGLDSERQPPPIILTMSREEDIKVSRTLDIIGYQIFRRLNSSTVVNFDSHSQNYNLLEDGKESFRYIDSLSKLFEKHVSLHQHKMRLFSFSSDVIVQVTEESTIKLSCPSEIRSSSLQLSKARSTPYALVQALLWQINEICIPVDVRKKNIQRTSIVELCAVLAYHPTKLAAIVDNENYTTLVASKQPFHCWSVNVSFCSKNVSSSISPNVSLSASLRRLLALFMYRKCEESSCTFDTESNSGMNEKIYLIEQTKAMAGVLSQETIRIVNSMCFNNDDQVAVQNEDVLIDSLLDLIFIENVSGDKDSGNGNGNGDGYWDEAHDPSSTTSSTSSSSSSSSFNELISESTKNNIELLSLQTFCMASLQTFISSANLWSRFLLILRSRWEHGAQMPGVYGERIEHSLNDEKQSLHKRLLWNDVITKKDVLSGFHPDYVVDRSTPILTQKLKALQFCILVKNEKVTCDPFGDGVLLQRRLPLTSDAYAQRMFVLEKLRPEIHDIKNENRSKNENCHDVRNKINNDNQNLNIEVKKDDVVQLEGDNKGESNNADKEGKINENKIIEENPDIHQKANTSLSAVNLNEVVSLSQLQYWKVENEILISDMSAWKSFHGFEEEGSFHGFEDFLVWYLRDENAYKCRIEDNKKDLTAFKEEKEKEIDEEKEKMIIPEIQLRSRKVFNQKNKNKIDVGVGVDVDVDTLLRNILDDESHTENVPRVQGDDVIASQQHVDAGRERGRGRGIECKGKEAGLSQGSAVDLISSSERSVWAILWHSSSPARSVSEQKALFNAEREAEKILGFLGSMAPVHVVSDLILSSMAASIPVLAAMVDRNISIVSALMLRLSPSSDVSTVRNILGQEHSMKNLLDLILQASIEVRVDVTHCIDRRNECSVSQTALLCVDSVANLTEQIEDYCTKVRTLGRTLDQAFQNLHRSFQADGGELISVFASVLPLLMHSVCSSGEGSFIPKNVREVSAE